MPFAKNSIFFRILSATTAFSCMLVLTSCTNSSSTEESTSLPTQTPSSASISSGTDTFSTNSYQAIPLPTEMKAMWVSFLEWASADVNTEEKMTAYAKEVSENCKDLGLNTLIVTGRGFSDAYYKSEFYPWSHLLTGTQGQDPGFDPLAIFIEQAHTAGLRFEVMVNPFRAQHGMYKDIPLASTNPAAQNPSWIDEISGTTWYNPGIPEVQQLVIDGVAEIVQNYDVDGVQFDDYFYPSGIDESFDATQFAEYGNGTSLADWRRENINQTVQGTYNAIKEMNPSVSFGISPAGNNQNNFDVSYADVFLWLETDGYVDYIMPQLYWGFNYQSKNGDTAPAFANKCAEWGSLPRSENVRLYAGLAAYALQEGDGSAGDQSEWKSGKILADMVTYLENTGEFSGFSLFRYAYLYKGNAPASDLATKEISALKAVLA